MRLEVVATSSLWSDFIVRLLCFVTSSVWIIWPILSAGVDDHSELSRYSNLPISSFRLMIASMIAGQLEPRALVFYGPLVGTSAAYVLERPPAHWGLVLVCAAAYVMFNAAMARVGLHIVLNILRKKRSAVVLGGGFFVVLGLAALIPPVDVSWLVGMTGVGDVDADLVLGNAVLALGRFPTGLFAHALAASHAGALGRVILDTAALVVFMLAAIFIAHRLLEVFHEHAERAPSGGRLQRRDPIATTGSQFSTLVVREALDLWNNPRARLLASVPFLLAILLKILSGRELIRFFAGPAVDAWLMGGLCLYGAIVIGATFSQNAFAYDGQGFAMFLSAPISLAEVLRAKNVVHGFGAMALAGIVAVFYAVYFRAGGVIDVALSLAGAACLVPVLLTAGNFLSISFPVKFHSNLKRRDRLPLVASMLGMAAASAGASPWAAAVRIDPGASPGLPSLGAVATAAALAWALYWVSYPAVVRRMLSRREFIWRAVTREER
jgi:ABC-2 type transport system permease protein